MNCRDEEGASEEGKHENEEDLHGVKVGEMLKLSIWSPNRIHWYTKYLQCAVYVFMNSRISFSKSNLIFFFMFIARTVNEQIYLKLKHSYCNLHSSLSFPVSLHVLFASCISFTDMAKQRLFSTAAIVFLKVYNCKVMS